MSSKILTVNKFGPRLSVETKANRPGRTSWWRSAKTANRSGRAGGGSAWVAGFNLAISALIVALVGTHIYTVNAYAAKGYELKQHHQNIALLEEEGKKLLMRQAETASLLQLREVALAQGLVPIVNEEFVNNPQVGQR